MNFFQSVFSDDPDPSSPEADPQSPNSGDQNTSPSIPTITSAWTFGSSLMKTLASKSESVIETYRRDLEEFSSGIKKETAVIREAATRAVKDLPTSLEAGAGLAQESLESVGKAIDDLGTTVTVIIAHGKDSILAADYSDSDSDLTDPNVNKRIDSREGFRFSKPYSRLDAQIRTIQSDMNTYLEDPDDLETYNEWKLGFKIDEKAEEIYDLINGDNGVVGDIHREIVPSRVAEDSFWTRYFFRVYKIKKAEEARAQLVKRAISGEEEEELSWDVDEDDYEENAESDSKINDKEDDEKVGVSEPKNGNQIESKAVNFEANSDSKVGSEGKTDRDSDISVVSSLPSPDEEGWDEIEDVGSGDESKGKAVVCHGSPSKEELQKRLSITAEEEDLTWDIEEEEEEEEEDG